MIKDFKMQDHLDCPGEPDGITKVSLLEGNSGIGVREDDMMTEAGVKVRKRLGDGARGHVPRNAGSF